MSDSFSFDSIQILESLRPGDPKTGEDLADKLTYGSYDLAVRFRRPATRVELLNSLTELAEWARRDNHSPIVHIEAHGSSRGVQVSSGEHVLWTEMKDAFTEINVASRLNLLVAMAACQGGHVSEILQPTDRVPACLILGPNSDLSPDDLKTDFRVFYDELFTTRNGRRALERLNGAPVGPGWRYAFISARYLFRRVFGDYVKTLGTQTALKEREALIVREMVDHNAVPPELRAAIREGLADHEMHFPKMRRQFFMLDLFPETERRFPLTLVDCLCDPVDDPDDPPPPEESTRS